MIKITPKMQSCQYEGYIFRIPNHMVDGLELYINYRIKPGSFMIAVLSNDLMGAVGNADHLNIKNIPAYINFLYNFAPPECFGSYEKVKAWLEGGK